MNNIIRWYTAILLILSTSAVQALTYQPMLDEDLLDQSPVVVRGYIASSDYATSGVSRYQLGVTQVYKGDVPVNQITVEVPGNAWYAGLRIPGMPRFEAGNEVVLFLDEGVQGVYRIMQMTLGAFTATTDITGNKVYRRQLSGSQALARTVPSRGAISEVPRDAVSFLQWLGDPAPQDSAAKSARSDASGRTEQDEFTTLGTGNPSRWWRFDLGQQVSFRAHSSGQDGMNGGGFAEFQQGIAAWTNDAGSLINYVYGGTTSASGGVNSPDGVTAILFNDPNNEVTGTFSCSTGGVLALGGFTTSGNTQQFQNRTFEEIIEGNIVTNNGTGCFFGLNGNSNGEEVFGHELGHTLGLGHSCEEQEVVLGLPLGPNACQTATTAARDALMKATPHADGRGADLRSDDRAGAAFLYPRGDSSEMTDDEPSGSADPVPAAPPVSSGGGGGGGGGCTVLASQSFDPLWLFWLVLSLIWVARRHTVSFTPTR